MKIRKRNKLKVKLNIKMIRTYLLVFCIILLALFSTVVYSAISSTMTVSGDAYARVEADVRITNFSLYEASSDVVSSYEEYNKNAIASNISFPTAGSYVIYRVEVTNYGSVPVGVYSITKKNTSLNYELIDYKVKDKLCDEYGNCTTMAKKTFYIKFKGTAVGTYNINLTFDFRVFYPVTYDGITNNGYPTEVLKGDTLTVNFTEVLTGKVGLKVNDNFVDYTFHDNVLKLTNVNGPVNLYMETNLYNIVQLASGDEEVPSLPSTYMQYFYPNETTDNNVLFAGKCWKGIRTTKMGGVKLIYSGLPGEDGSCMNTGEALSAGKSEMLSEEDLLANHPDITTEEDLYKYVLSYSGVGYMYGEGYLTLPKELGDSVSTNISYYSYSSSNNNNYYFSDSVVYENGTYTLQNPAQYVWADSYESLKGYYTCMNTSSSCSYVYYVGETTSTSYRVLSLSGGETFDSDKFILFKDEGLSEAISIDKIEWYNNHSNYVGYYTCLNMKSSSCNDVFKIYNTSNSYAYLTSGKNYLYGNDVKYENGVYKLIDTYKSGYWYEDYVNIGNAHHYTCFSDSDTCESVYYIVAYIDEGPLYMTLSNGENIEDAKVNMSKNIYDSTLKKFVDNWYENNMVDYTNMLEDTPWCVDKKVYMGPLVGKDYNILLSDSEGDTEVIPVNIYGDIGWLFELLLASQGGIYPDGMTEEQLENMTEEELALWLVDNIFNLNCSTSNIQNQFSVDPANGNGLSKYPVSLLTAKEMLFGNYSTDDSFLGPQDDSDTDYHMTATGFYPLPIDGGNIPLPISFTMGSSMSAPLLPSNYGVRPVVTVKVGAEVVEGNGTGTNPFKLNESVLGATK